MQRLFQSGTTHFGLILRCSTPKSRRPSMRRSLLLGMIVLALVAVLAGKAWSALACIVFDMGPVQNGEMYFVDYYDPENCNVEPEARYWIDIAQLDPQD